jgi:hypothetical protein
VQSRNPSRVLKRLGYPLNGAGRVEVCPKSSETVRKDVQADEHRDSHSSICSILKRILPARPAHVPSITLSTIVNQIQCPYNPAAVQSNGFFA